MIAKPLYLLEQMFGLLLQPTRYTHDTNLDLEPGVHCVTAWLYEVGTLVDTQNSCITIEDSNQSAEIVYAVVNEQFGTFDHKVTIKSGSLQAGESYVLDWELVDGNQNVISSERILDCYPINSLHP